MVNYGMILFNYCFVNYAHVFVTKPDTFHSLQFGSGSSWTKFFIFPFFFFFKQSLLSNFILPIWFLFFYWTKSFIQFGSSWTKPFYSFKLDQVFLFKLDQFWFRFKLDQDLVQAGPSLLFFLFFFKPYIWITTPHLFS